MNERIRKGYYLSVEVAEMLKRMSADELRSLSNELEMCIRDRYRKLYQEISQERAAQQERDYDHG